MRLSKFYTLGFLATSTYANPIDRYQNAESATSLAVPDPGLEERAFPSLKQFGKGIFWFGVGAIGQGKDVWLEMIDNCQEWIEEKAKEKGPPCMWSILSTTFHAAVYAQGSYQTAITFANVMNNGVGGGDKRALTKRIGDGSLSWDSHWASASPEQKEQLRSQMRQVHHTMNLHSLGDGSPTIEKSVSFYMNHGDPDIPGPYIRHVTNGTHGYSHPVVPTQKRDSTWGFGNNVAGLKFSYDRPCFDEVVGDTVQNGDDYLDSIVAFEQYAAANPSDRWTVEFDDQHSGSLIMYGTLVAEKNGFGTDYEVPSFDPMGFCHGSH